MDAHPAAKAELTPFQRFDAFTRRVMSVPKSEIERRAVLERKRRQGQKRSKAR